MGDFVLMPKLGMTMTQGKIVKWLKTQGEKVEKGDYIFEVETDKTTLEVDSLHTGRLIKRYYEEGDTVPCDAQVAYIGEEADEIPNIKPISVSGTEGAEEKINQPLKTDSSTKKLQVKPLAFEDDTKYDYDLAVIGGGPGGYVAALRAAQLGAKTVLIEKDTVGGTCLNRGCIPTKALYTSAKQFRHMKNASAFGLKVTGVEIDFAQVMKRKDRIVKQLTDGVAFLLKKSKVEVVKGTAKMDKEHEIKVGDRTITCRFAILATGGKPYSVLRTIAKDIEIYNTDTLMGLNDLPKSMAIVGGGIIGCEIGCIMNSFGVDVTIIEKLPTIMPVIDSELTNCLTDHMIKNGVSIFTEVTVSALEYSGAQYRIRLTDGTNVKCDMILEAVGRKAQTQAFEALDVSISDEGFVQVDSFMCTNLPSVFAVGDINGISQLAHAASEQGITAVERMFGGLTETQEQAIASCVFTDLEIAYVGITEAQAKGKGLEPRTFKFPFASNGKALTLGQIEGFVKVVYDGRFGEILGVHIIGPEASSLIHEAVVGMRLEATAEYLGTTIHAHPTLSEALMEAFLGCSKGALHI